MRTIAFAIALLLSTVRAQADIVSLAGLTTITAPGIVGFNFLGGTLNTQVIFAERQAVTLGSPLVTDTGTIAAGKIVDSWFIATNDVLTPVMKVANLEATFNGAILGMVYLSNALFEPSPNYVLTNFLGAPGTTYNLGPNCFTCGWETFQTNTDQFAQGLGFDIASFSENTFTGHSVYGQPGEYTRLVVEHTAAVPGPIAGAGIPGLIAACGFLLALARRRRNR
jgi:hypothetical protein